MDKSILSKNGFLSPTKGVVTIGKIISEIADFISEDPKRFYSVVVGSDSQIKYNNKNHECDFVTAIVIYRCGEGARYFWKREKVMEAPLLREKIYNETSRSLEIANMLMPFLKDTLPDERYNFEIHVDIGPNGKTKNMIKEIIGMVNGYGFTAKTKPESWGASSVADKHT